MYHDPIDYETIQRRVVARVRRRYGFFFHTAIFVLGLPVIGGFGSAFGFFLWTGAWILHLVWMSYQNNIEKAIEHEIELEQQKVYKRKREYADLEARYENGDFRHDYDERPAWLSDDGELVGTNDYDEYTG
ncbi:MAG: hypothetical protein AAFN11_04235 [Chloroflexota bacterium]